MHGTGGWRQGSRPLGVVTELEGLHGGEPQVSCGCLGCWGALCDYTHTAMAIQVRNWQRASHTHTHTPAMEVQVRSWRSACSPQLERLVLSMRAVAEVRQGVKPGILHSRSRRVLRWLRADSGLGVRAAEPVAAGVCELENLWGETRWSLHAVAGWLLQKGKLLGFSAEQVTVNLGHAHCVADIGRLWTSFLFLAVAVGLSFAGLWLGWNPKRSFT